MSQIKPKHPGGRPTNLTKEVLKKASQYISDDPEVNYKSHNHAVPSVVGLCRVINRSRSTLYRWAEDEGTQFWDIMNKLNELQELSLVNGTLTGTLNANIGKTMLIKHGYSDREDNGMSITINVQRDKVIDITPEVQRIAREDD